jgi:hypothetical protein
MVYAEVIFLRSIQGRILSFYYIMRSRNARKEAHHLWHAQIPNLLLDAVSMQVTD